MKIFIFFIIMTLVACSSAPELPGAIDITTTQDTILKPIGSMTNEAIEHIEPSIITTNNTIPNNQLLAYIQAAIIPKYQDWVILKNGTYIIFDNIDTIPNIQQKAIEWIRFYSPRRPEDNNWDYSITDLDQAEGWAVFGNGYGIYTFVHPNELPEQPSPQQIGSFAKAKRALDEKNPQIIYISSSKGIVEIKNG